MISGGAPDSTRIGNGSVPPGIDSSRPSVARVYDFALGGKDNYAVDRALYEQISAVYPEYRAFAQANRRFMVRAVRRMADAGITQFLDLGTGIPTSPNVHEVAREQHPDARVVYVDNDPVVLAHGRALLARHAGVVAVNHDIRLFDEVLADDAVTATLDLTRPVGVLCSAVMHFVPIPEAVSVLAGYRAALAPGSHLALSTFQADPTRMSGAEQGQTDHVAASLSTQLVFRTVEEITELFTGFTVLPPGLLDVSRWTIGDGPKNAQNLWCLAGIGRLDEA